MDYPIHLRPKFRLLAKIMSGKIKLPKRYRFKMTSSYWDNIDFNPNYSHNHKCSPQLSHFVKIYQTPDGRGKGAYANIDLDVGVYLGCYLGRVVDNLEEYEISYFPDVAYRFEIPFNDWVICAKDYGNETRYFNHSDKENVEVRGICHEGEYHLGFFTKEKIKKGDEMTINYGEGYWNTAASFGIKKIDNENTLL